MAYKKNYTPKTKEELKKEMDALIEKSSEQIKKYQASPKALLELADFMSTIHKYSLRNLALIDSQFRGARAVASFADWKKKGFFVQGGEKGIQIFVHTPIQRFQNSAGEWKNISDATPEEKAKIKSKEYEMRKVNAFKRGAVFDVSQTNAKPEDLPEIFPNKVWNFSLEGENSLKELNLGVGKIAESLGIEIADIRKYNGHEIGVARGQYVQFVGGHEEIHLNHRNSETQNISTSIHELAHKHLHQENQLIKLTDEQKALGMTSKSVKEFQAELTSYIVCKNYGMDTSEKTIPYIADWTNNLNRIDPRIMIDILDGVRSTSQKFISIMDDAILSDREMTKERTPIERENLNNVFEMRNSNFGAAEASDHKSLYQGLTNSKVPGETRFKRVRSKQTESVMQL